MVPLYIHLSYGELLRLYRHRKSLTLSKAASIIKVSSKTMKNYEEDITFPSFGTYLKLNKLYGEEFAKLAEFVATKSLKSHKAKIRFKTPLYSVVPTSFSKIRRFKVSDYLILKIKNSLK